MTDVTDPTCPACNGPHQSSDDDCPSHHPHQWRERQIWVKHEGAFVAVPHYAIRHCVDCVATEILYHTGTRQLPVHPYKPLMPPSPLGMPPAMRVLYEEARDISRRSPGCAVVLLRLALVQWCLHKGWYRVRIGLRYALTYHLPRNSVLPILLSYVQERHSQNPGLYDDDLATDAHVVDFAGAICDLVNLAP